MCYNEEFRARAIAEINRSREIKAMVQKWGEEIKKSFEELRKTLVRVQISKEQMEIFSVAEAKVTQQYETLIARELTHMEEMKILINAVDAAEKGGRRVILKNQDNIQH